METEGLLSGKYEACNSSTQQDELNRIPQEIIAHDETIRFDRAEANDECSDDDAIEFLHEFSTQKEERVSSAEGANEKCCSGKAPSLITATLPSSSSMSENAALPTAVVTMSTQTIEQLVSKLTDPGCATDSSNGICTAIMLHPELLSSPSVLGMHPRMDGGLQNYVPGTAHAWLYTPKKRRRKRCNDRIDGTTTGFALIFVYPDVNRASSANVQGTQGNTKLHFGGRSYSLCNNSVLLQHGGHKLLR